MKHVRRNVTLSLALGLGIMGCAVPSIPHQEGMVAPQPGRVTLTLQPRLTEAPALQAVVRRHLPSDIVRLDVIPYVETSLNVYQPLSSTSGLPTDDNAPDLLRVSQTGDDVVMARPVRLSGLAPNQKYRIFARAYDAQGTLISSDVESYVEVSIGNETEGPANVTPIPLKIADVPFAARVAIALTNAFISDYDHMVTSLSLVTEGGEIPVPGTSQTIHRSQLHYQTPKHVWLNGLRAQSTYRFNTSLRNALGSEVGTASVNVVVGIDDTPPALTLKTPATWLAGDVTTLAGNGTPGLENGSGLAARFLNPRGVAVDSKGNVLVADTGNHVIRKITSAGAVSTYAGPTFVDMATGQPSGFNEPIGIAFEYQDSDIEKSGFRDLIVTDSKNHVIRKLQGSGFIFTHTGSGNPGFEDVTFDELVYEGKFASFNSPSGFAGDQQSGIYVADTGNHAIRMIESSGAVAPFVGNGASGFANGNGTSATFHSPRGVARDSQGTFYVADTGNHAIRKITPAGDVSTLAGNGTLGFTDGSGTAARFNAPSGLALDKQGNLYVADTGNHAIRKITPAGIVTTVAGGSAGLADGKGTAAKFQNPFGLTLDAQGGLYVVDTDNHAIRKIQ